MNDDEMDDLLIQGAQDYNEPGTVPRDEMWTRVSAARRATRSRHRARTWGAASIAAAAVLVIGIVIGRRLERPSIAPQQTVAVAPIAPPVSAAPTPISVPPATVAQQDSVIQQFRTETKNTQRRTEQLVAAAPEGAGRGSEQGASLAYRLVVLQHLAGSEAMITAFRSSAKRGEVDAQIASWSRELLSTTRMLEASPVTQDPTMKRLLEDLDLVIVQIARYTTRGTNNPDDLDLIEQSINKRSVITKLRGSLPARNAPVGT
jgi:hypothetical protein